jgi:AmiR/NasT family two-component response regulator
MSKPGRILMAVEQSALARPLRAALEGDGYEVLGCAPESAQINGLLKERQPDLVVLEATHVAEWRRELERRKLIERAKGILMQARGWSEAEAHRWMQQQARRENSPLEAVAVSILRSHQTLFAPGDAPAT